MGQYLRKYYWLDQMCHHTPWLHSLRPVQGITDFSQDILACQSRNNTGPTNNGGSKPLSIQVSQVGEWVSMNKTRALEQAKLNGMKSSLKYEITPVFVKMCAYGQTNSTEELRMNNLLLRVFFDGIWRQKDNIQSWCSEWVIWMMYCIMYHDIDVIFLRCKSTSVLSKVQYVRTGFLLYSYCKNSKIVGSISAEQLTDANCCYCSMDECRFCSNHVQLENPHCTWSVHRYHITRPRLVRQHPPLHCGWLTCLELPWSSSLVLNLSVFFHISTTIFTAC